MSRNLLVSLVFLLAVGGASAAPVSEAEAREFCLSHWFPALRFGAGLTAAEKEAKLDRLMRFYTERAEFVDPNNQDHFGKDVLVGHADLRRYYGTVLSAYPEWVFEIKAIYPTPDGFVLHYEGRNAPPVARFEGVDILKIERGPEGSGPSAFRIRKLEGFYDRLPFAPRPR